MQAHTLEDYLPWLSIHFFGSLALSTILVRLGSLLARRLKFVDHPNANTGNVGGATLGGGVAIVVTILVIQSWPFDFESVQGRVLLVTSCACLVGLLDDIFRLNPLVKVVGQLCCALLYTIHLPIEIQWHIPVITFLVLSSNAWNVVDVMDSLLGSIGAICLLGSCAVMLLFGIGLNALPAMALSGSGAIFGFLYWNRPPAKVLMGDAGSLALGLFYGILVIEAWMINAALGLVLIIPGLIPFLEVGFLIIQRTKRRVPFYQTTPDHFALRLLHNGRRIRQIIVPVVLVAVGLSCLASVLVIVGFGQVAIVASIALLAAGTIWANRFFSQLPVRGPAE